MLTTIEDLPVFEPAPVTTIAEHLAAVEPVRAQSWIARSSRGLEVLSYEGCEIVFKDDRFMPGIQKLLGRMGLEKEEMTVSGGRNMLLSEGADHLAVHRVVSRWFTPKRITQIRDRVADLVSELVRPVTSSGAGDFMDQVARRLPGPVFCWMIGVDPAQGDRLFAISEVILQAFSGDPAVAGEVGQAAADMRVFVEEAIAAKRDDPGDDLLTIMLDAVGSGDLTEDDVHTLSFEMLSASTDNTANAAGLAVMLLARHPDQWRLLTVDPAGLAQRAVEECMRVEPRVRYAGSWTPGPVTLLDFGVSADSMVYLDLVSAHHDPSAFPDPHRFDVTRQYEKPQLNFGTGRHYCLGAALARMELQVVLEQLAADWTAVSLGGEPELVFRGLDISVRRLPVEVTRSGGG